MRSRAAKYCWLSVMALVLPVMVHAQEVVVGVPKVKWYYQQNGSPTSGKYYNTVAEFMAAENAHYNGGFNECVAQLNIRQECRNYTLTEERPYGTRVNGVPSSMSFWGTEEYKNIIPSWNYTATPFQTRAFPSLYRHLSCDVGSVSTHQTASDDSVSYCSVYNQVPDVAPKDPPICRADGSTTTNIP
jgi:hypothetical protein